MAPIDLLDMDSSDKEGMHTVERRLTTAMHDKTERYIEMAKMYAE